MLYSLFWFWNRIAHHVLFHLRKVESNRIVLDIQEENKGEEAYQGESFMCNATIYFIQDKWEVALLCVHHNTYFIPCVHIFSIPLQLWGGFNNVILESPLFIEGVYRETKRDTSSIYISDTNIWPISSSSSILKCTVSYYHSSYTRLRDQV